MKLIRAELVRLFARRFTRIALVGVLLLLAGIATVIWITNHKPTPADRLSAHIAAEQALTERNAAYQQCVDAQSRTPSPGATDGRGSTNTHLSLGGLMTSAGVPPGVGVPPGSGVGW